MAQKNECRKVFMVIHVCLLYPLNIKTKLGLDFDFKQESFHACFYYSAEYNCYDWRCHQQKDE